MKFIKLKYIFMVMIFSLSVHCDNDSEKINLAKRRFVTNALKIIQICSNETGHNINIFELYNPSYATPEKKCFLACMMSKFGLIDHNKRLSVDGLKTMAYEMTDGNLDVIDEMEAIGKECSRIYDNNICELAYKYDLCILDQVKIRNINFGYSI